MGFPGWASSSNVCCECKMVQTCAVSLPHELAHSAAIPSPATPSALHLHGVSHLCINQLYPPLLPIVSNNPSPQENQLQPQFQVFCLSISHANECVCYLLLHKCKSIWMRVHFDAITCNFYMSVCVCVIWFYTNASPFGCAYT